jgi:dTDP-4-dehydrorhamnose reductase
MKIGVTGASSGIGTAVVRMCHKSEYEVVEFTRAVNKPNQRHFDLASDDFDFEVTDLDAMVHLGWDRKLDKHSGLQVSVAASKALIDKCQASSVKMVFLSSISANPESESAYGRSKYVVEEHAKKNGFGVVRSGVIWGGQLSGFIEILLKISNLPLINFSIIPDPVMQLTEESALASFLIENVVNDSRSQTKDVFVNGEMRLSQMLSLMTSRKHLLKLAIPLSVAHGFARALRAVRIPTLFDPDSLKSSTDAFALQESENIQLHGSSMPSLEFHKWILQMASNK